ncbi:type II restriction/modification system DNA methylase subunit YeeA [Luteibacter sp. OK325]|uniref:class I SAM-dependent DNA methyltransferase n=1 Tax=Luteibacter sp. OK325 TaxID=2135670 RepID=UPI000D3B6D7B|nr:DNA methyltransferase [Luteibacter sp. OK325]PTR28493.1 type II restriction/modification system DNA methylase subunit YeeA [Luteibacter sp. OK325]
MNLSSIEEALKGLVSAPFNARTFVFGLLEAYDVPRATLAKLGKQEWLENASVLIWKGKLHFLEAPVGEAERAYDALELSEQAEKRPCRFILVTDGIDFFAKDLKQDRPIHGAYAQLNDSFEFFLPMVGIERFEDEPENIADVKATGRLSKLYDAILDANPTWLDERHTHELNVFMTRLLFCLFAESTGIFQKKIFSTTVFTLSGDDGDGTSAVIDQIFRILDIVESDRGDIPEFLGRFPYVNGLLFREVAEVPAFSKTAKRLLKECVSQDWGTINPDIFGSMIQAIVHPELRGDLGMHYTSVPNILKTLKPLFLSDLEQEFESRMDDEEGLRQLLKRIYGIRVLDPACGSGNFLITAYRELRELETKIFLQLQSVAKQWSLSMSGIRLDHFFGIEVTDFAAETAKLSLWIAEYQMNRRFEEVFNKSPAPLPLSDSGHILCRNALHTDWSSVCPKVLASEIYVVGNPPYLGSVFQTAEQKEDMRHVFSGHLKTYKDLDYVAAWFVKGAEYAQKTGAKLALVSTNSICQGEQVGMLWPILFRMNQEIFFAHQSFKWQNSASKNAAVMCVVVGLRSRQKGIKTLFQGTTARTVSNIGPYLVEMDDTIVFKRTKAISDLPQMDYGNKPTDGRNLILDARQRDELLQQHPEAEKFVRKYMGSKEFIKGIERWCIWVGDDVVEEARNIPELNHRFARVATLRRESNGKQANANAATPYRFVYRPHRQGEAIIVPGVASERRRYTPIGLLSGATVISNLAFAIYDASDFVFALLSSRLHTVWLAAVGGRMKSDYRYSNTLVYNTFPVPSLSSAQKDLLAEHSLSIIEAREAHPGRSLAWMYDPATMPENLLEAHAAVDAAVEEIYIGRTFKDDAERLEHLIKRYSSAFARTKRATAVRKSKNG